MKERPILMSSPMVRAILSDTKTQTRRVVKHHRFGFPSLLQVAGNFIWAKFAGSPFPDMLHSLKCPYGVPAALDSDRLWVKETFAADFEEPRAVLYRADESIIDHDTGERSANATFIPQKWRPSIFMPRHQLRGCSGGRHRSLLPGRDGGRTR